MYLTEALAEAFGHFLIEVERYSAIVANACLRMFVLGYEFYVANAVVVGILCHGREIAVETLRYVIEPLTDGRCDTEVVAKWKPPR